MERVLVLGLALFAAGKAQSQTPVTYDGDTKSIIDRYCAGSCHSAQLHFGNVDLSTFRIAINGQDVKASWRFVLRVLELGRMPPESAPAPTDAERQALAQWERGDFPQDRDAAERLTFDAKPNERRILPFVNLRGRLVQFLRGAGQSDPARYLAGLDPIKTHLGGHDYANAIGENLTYTPTKAALWMQLASAVCADPLIVGKYSGTEGFSRLVQDTLGSPPDQEDWAIFQAQATLPENQRFASTCVTYLSSMGFLGL